MCFIQTRFLRRRCSQMIYKTLTKLFYENKFKIWLRREKTRPKSTWSTIATRIWLFSIENTFNFTLLNIVSHGNWILLRQIKFLTTWCEVLFSIICCTYY